MKVRIVTPAPLDLPIGNTITAMRWAGILRTLGHRVNVVPTWDGDDCDLLIALHASRSQPTIERFVREHPHRSVVVALTGTDLYRDLQHSDSGHRSLQLANHIVVLQDAALESLDENARARATVIYQSARPPMVRKRPSSDYFDVCILSHLRAVKDPLRGAYAARLLPQESRIRVRHAGRLLEPEWLDRVREEEAANPRYRWIGELSHETVMELLDESRLLILSSIMEGGASAIAEAVVCGVPVLCSKIPGNVGMLGRNYPGYFSVGDTEETAELLRRAEVDSNFLEALKTAISKLQHLFAPEGEMACWIRLLDRL